MSGAPPAGRETSTGREPAPALLARGLTKRYGPARAIDGVDLAVPSGQSVALLGPNGAGKSTLLRLCAVLIRPTSGTLRIHGESPRTAGRPPLMRRIGLLAHQTFLYDHLTGLENLVFYARLYDLPDPVAAARVALREVRLEQRATDLARAYSRGMQQRLAIARALLHSPDIVLLDEPFTGLDRDAADRLEEKLGRVRKGGATCVMATHDFVAGLRHADRVVGLASGRVIVDRPARGLDAASLDALFRDATRSEAELR